MYYIRIACVSLTIILGFLRVEKLVHIFSLALMEKNKLFPSSPTNTRSLFLHGTRALRLIHVWLEMMIKIANAGGSKAGDGINQRKTISLYEITFNDNPEILITHVQLKEENYDRWARSKRTALRARNEFDFIDEAIRRPDEQSLDHQLVIGVLDP